MRMASHGMAALVVAGLCASQAAAFGKRHHGHGCDGGAAQAVVAGTHMSAVATPALMTTNTVVTSAPVRPVVRASTLRSAFAPSALALTDIAPTHLMMGSALPAPTHLMMASALPVAQTHLTFGLVGVSGGTAGTGTPPIVRANPDALASVRANPDALASTSTPACDPELTKAVKDLTATLGETNRQLAAISRRPDGAAGGAAGGATEPNAQARASESVAPTSLLRPYELAASDVERYVSGGRRDLGVAVYNRSAAELQEHKAMVGEHEAALAKMRRMLNIANPANP